MPQCIPCRSTRSFSLTSRDFSSFQGCSLTKRRARCANTRKSCCKTPKACPSITGHRLPGQRNFSLIIQELWGLLQAVIAPEREHIRLESVFISSRSAESNENPWRPHVGGANLDPSLSYRYHNGRIYGGMTRIVWELNEVKKGQGGTYLVPGSHKANLASHQDGTWPQEADDPDSGVWETYGCPPGSLIMFSEGVRHSGSPWTNPDHPRRAILIAYNHVTVRFHEPKPCMNPQVIGGMSAAHQQFFQDVWILSNARRNK